MTREDLSQYHGCSVIISLDGKMHLAPLDATNLEKPYLGIPKPGTGLWKSLDAYPLSDTDIASMTPNSPNTLFSTIRIEGDNSHANV